MILACLLFWSILSYLVITRFVVMATEVEGDSMVPTLENGDRLLLQRFVFHRAAPDRGQIVALKLPHEEDLMVKRVVAVSGELIQIRDGRVHVNGRRLGEPYLPHDTVTDPGALSSNTFKVLLGCYFVLGDNRRQSLDSRSFGAVRKEWILGRVVGLRQAGLDLLGW
jgi:signal peptidase I